MLKNGWNQWEELGRGGSRRESWMEPRTPRTYEDGANEAWVGLGAWPELGLRGFLESVLA